MYTAGLSQRALQASGCVAATRERPRRSGGIDPLSQRTLEVCVGRSGAYFFGRSIKMHALRGFLLLALAPVGAALAGPAPQDDAVIAACPGPSLPFYAFAAHGGDQLARYHGPDWPEYYATFGLVNLDAPGYVLMENAGTLRLSRDRGCTFEDLAPVQDSPLWLTTAPGGGAYGFAVNGTGFYDIAPDGSTFVVTKRRTPAAGILGVGVDPANPRHVY